MTSVRIAMPEEWLTRRELAKALKVSPSTIARLDLPYLAVGNQNRYKMSEVVRALQGGGDVVPLRRGRAA